MIVKKIWVNTNKSKKHIYKDVEMYGWFLFGFIPIYIVEHRTIG